MKFSSISIMAIFVLLVCPATANAVYREVLEEHVTYEAVKGDYIEKIAGITGVEVKCLLEQNPEYKRKKFLHPGDRFSVVRRTIVPDKVGDGTLINIPDRTLYQFMAGNLVTHYPVGVGMRNRIWQTPVGEFVVTGKEKNPTWHVPKLIQKEMARKGEPVKDVVPPGKDNPLGRFEVRLSVREYLIHETIWPESIYNYRSHGCIRLKPGDAEKYFNSVTKGERVTVIYEPVKVAITDSGRVFLEVHEDTYGKVGDLYGIASAEITDANASNRVNWDKVKTVVGKKSGIAEDITKEYGG